MTTSAHKFPSQIAIALPIPLLAPVISAVWPVRSDDEVMRCFVSLINKIKADCTKPNKLEQHLLTGKIFKSFLKGVSFAFINCRCW